MIERELGQPLATLYRSFDERRSPPPRSPRSISPSPPRASEVAVKVLRPGIDAAFARDLDLFFWLAEPDRAAASRASRRLKPREVVADAGAVGAARDGFALRGGRRLGAGATISRDDPSFRVPQVDWRRTARQVLTLERVGGIRDRRPRRADRRRARSARHHGQGGERLLQPGVPRRLLPRRSASRQSVHRRGRAPSSRSISASWAGSTARRAITSPTCCWLSSTGDYRRVAEVHFEAGYVPRASVARLVRPGLPRHRRADPRPAAARDLARPAAGAAVPGHRAVRDGDAAAAAAAAEDHGAGRRGRADARSRRSTCGRWRAR